MNKRAFRVTAVGVTLAVVFVLNCGDDVGETEPYDYPWRVYGVPGLSHYSDITGIYMVSTREGWGCVDNGEIIRFDGPKWRVFCSSNTETMYEHLLSMSFSGPTDGWVVGYRYDVHADYDDRSPIVLHYDGVKWREVAAPPSASLATVYALAPDDVWAGGSDGFFHYDGSSWTHYRAASDITAVDFFSPSYGWGIDSHGEHWLWDGARWRPVAGGGCNQPGGVSAPSPGSGWSVGAFSGDCEIPTEIVVAYYDAVWDTWRSYGRLSGTPAEHRPLHAVHFAAPDDGWAAGQVCLRYAGSRWTQVPLPPFTCAYSVFTLGGDEVWLGCSDGKLLKYAPPQGRASP